MSKTKFVHAFREAAPYIHYLRDKTLVIGISSELLNSTTLLTLAADLNLLASLGVRLVLIFDAESQIQVQCHQYHHPIQHIHGRLLVNQHMVNLAKQICGGLYFDFQAAFSLGFAHSPQRNPRLRLSSGNFISAKPMGVIDGTDMLYTGSVRKVDTAAIHSQLNERAIVLISPIATSLGGQSYFLSHYETAEAVAVALQAEKLIFIEKNAGISDGKGSFFNSLTAKEAQTLAKQLPENDPIHTLLNVASHALSQGVSRVQILSGHNDGDLIQELFTRNGAGTSIAQDSLVTIRPAQERDIAEIINLIRPLEEQGILVHRSREYLEHRIQDFFVLENDRQICGCVALKHFHSTPEAAELACLAIAPETRTAGYGALLLKHICQIAKQQNKQHLFALSTHTADWFSERGFCSASITDLPPERIEEYHLSGRQSKIFLLKL